MHRRWRSLGVACLMLALFGAGCGPTEEELAAQADQERREALAALEQQKQELDAKRAEKAELDQRLADAEGEAEAEPEEGEAAEAAEEMSPEQMQARADQLQREIEAKTNELYDALTHFINEDPPLVGEPLTETQLAAIRMKSDEDIQVAQEYIDKGGDYRRAITIYEDALKVDPDNERLQERLAKAQEMRYMTSERFKAVKKGMTENEVREALGPPNLFNVREYEDRGVTAWFYPKDEAGAAAGVWFRMKDHKVYRINFDAIEGRGEEAQEGTD